GLSTRARASAMPARVRRNLGSSIAACLVDDSPDRHGATAALRAAREAAVDLAWRAWHAAHVVVAQDVAGAHDHRDSHGRVNFGRPRTLPPRRMARLDLSQGTSPFT